MESYTGEYVFILVYGGHLLLVEGFLGRVIFSIYFD